MYKILKRLIDKKYYESKDEIQTKVDVFYAYGRINDDEYAELCELIEQNYPDVEPVEDIELPEDLADVSEG